MQIKFKEFDSNRRFGVELEVSPTVSRPKLKTLVVKYDQDHDALATTGTGSYGWADTKRNDYWHIKYDSTCGPEGKGYDYGWEVASYIASGISDMNKIAGLAQYMSDSGIKTNSNCGLHVHAEIKDFSTKEIGALIARWIKAESYLFAACNPSRGGNHYCQSLRQRMYSLYNFHYDPEDPSGLWNVIRPIDTSTHGNSEKKYTLNTVGFLIGQLNPLHDRITVEMRMPECVLDREHVFGWTLLFVNFVESCKSSYFAPQNVQPCKTISDAFDMLGLGTVYGSSFQILDRRLYDLKIWFLNKIIEKSTNNSLKEQAKEHLEFIGQM